MGMRCRIIGHNERVWTVNMGYDIRKIVYCKGCYTTLRSYCKEVYE